MYFLTSCGQEAKMICGLDDLIPLSPQLFGKLDELTNQLTSDEPKENVDASPTMLARQEQLQDAILSASSQMQKESQTLLDELRKVCGRIVLLLMSTVIAEYSFKGW